jgi:multimeric flavodoxin WrbA
VKEQAIMIKAVAVNGSPRKEKGNTAMILTPFLNGLMDAGAEVELVYASRLKIRPCVCSSMRCWYESPGECPIQDGMQTVYPKLRSADVLILATPVYVPLPGEMQNFINRLCPLIYPHLEERNGRTRARLRENVNIKQILLVSSGGWWEKENFEIVGHIVQHLAELAGMEFAGAVLRPHAFLMQEDGVLTSAGEEIVSAVRRAGFELAMHGAIDPQVLDGISRPLISEQELRQRYNQLL